MKKLYQEYGMLITVRASGDTYLFADSIDMDRYISTLIKMLKNSNNQAKMPRDKIIPLVAGMKSDRLIIVFNGGEEEVLRKIIRCVHISYSAYRRNKKSPLKFGKASYDILEGIGEIKEAEGFVKKEYDFVCSIK